MLTPQEKLQKLQELKDPSLKMNRILTDRSIAEAILKMGAVPGVKGDKGDKGDRGEQGITGIGKDGINGKDSVVPGPRGPAGETPVRGIHYWTESDRSKIISEAVAKIPVPRDGISPSIDDTVTKVTEILSKKPIHLNDIKGTEQLVSFLRSGGFRGGGLSTVAVDGVTITGNGTPSNPLVAVLGSSDVKSFNGRTGAVTSQSGDYTTSIVAEGTNLYFTNARAIASTLTGYTSTTGSISATDSILTAIEKLNGNMALGTTSIGSTITGGTANSILFVNPNAVIAQDNPAFTYTNTFGLHVGLTAGASNTFVGGYGGEFVGSNNTSGGVNLIVGNKSNGTSAFSDLFLQNDISDSSLTHYATVNLNSSTYNSTAFGTIFAVPNQLQLYGTDGPTTIGTSASSYINFFTGGTSTTNEIARITSAGLVIGGTTPASVFTVTQNALGGTAPALINSITLQNTTAAISGTQQVSPATVWSGMGFGTTAGTSQNVAFQVFVLPVQSTVPTATWQLQSSINGGAFANVLTITNTGSFTALGQIVSGAAAVGAAFSSNATGSSANFLSLGTGSASTTTSSLLFGGTSSVNYRLFTNGVTSTSILANNNYAAFIVGSAPITIPTSSTSALLANQVINPIGTVTRTGTGAVTNTASLYINGAASGTVTGSNYGLWTSGPTRIDVGSDATGDIYYRAATTGIFTRLGIGANGTHLVVSSGLPGWVAQTGVSNFTHTIFTPTTGQTISLINNQYNIVNPAGALLALTINLPTSPANNDVVFIKFTQTISTVTYANGTVVDGITAPTAGGLTVLVYDSGTTSWY